MKKRDIDFDYLPSDFYETHTTGHKIKQYISVLENKGPVDPRVMKTQIVTYSKKKIINQTQGSGESNNIETSTVNWGEFDFVFVTAVKKKVYI